MEQDGKARETEEELISGLKEKVQRILDMDPNFDSLQNDDEKYDHAVSDAIDTVIRRERDKQGWTLRQRKDLKQNLFNIMRRLDVLQPLLDDPSITEIMVNGPDDIFVEQGGVVSRRNIHFASEDQLKKIASQIARSVNRSIDESNPIVDARLKKDGSRVNVVYPPIALNGPIVTIRKFREDPYTMKDLVSLQSITEEVAELLQRMVQARYNIFISGGTGSGKTTFLNALSNYIPTDERIITIEDSAELQIKGVQNLVRLETRNPNMEGKGAVTIRDLIRTSLRMRPDRIIVGEVRGAEALDMLQAMNTGHDGSLSTGHANSTRDMLTRLEMMVLTAAEIPLEAIQRQIASAVDVIIHLSRLRDHTRRTFEITEVVDFKIDAETGSGDYELRPLYHFEEEGEDENGRIIGRLKRTEYEMKNTQKFRDRKVSDKV